MRWTPNQQPNHVGVGTSRRYVKVRTPAPIKTPVGKGAPSLVGTFIHSAVLLDEKPCRDESCTHESATEAMLQTWRMLLVLEKCGVFFGVVRIKRNRPDVDVLLYFRHGCV